jgi:NAD(P)H-hydrate epimerase
MKLLNAAQIRDWDAATLQRRHIPSLTLMERAAQACTDWLCNHYPPERPFIVVCGTGNNGGDGLAIARQLLAKGYAAAAFLVQHTDQLSPDCAANLGALKTAGSAVCSILREGDFITDVPVEVVIVDALFGTGLNRPLEGYAEAFVQRLNKLPNAKIAIDLPSGMPADEPPAEHAAIICAAHTLTFQQFKRAMLHPEAGRFCGEVHRLGIGLDADFSAGVSSHWHTLERATVRSIYRPRNFFSHKGIFGTAFLIAGSRGLMGAALLAVNAAGRAGAGKVRGLIPGVGYDVLQGGAPEAMCKTSGEDFIEEMEGWESAQGIGIGPGLGKHPKTVAAFNSFLEKIDRPVVLDADALNMLGENKSWMKRLPKRCILTPHPKEFERMFGPTRDSFARAETARGIAMEHGWIIIAKDARSLIALPDGNCYYVVESSPGMATGGSGDVLTGVLAAMLAQGYAPEEAALLGAWLHAAAGRLAAEKAGIESMLAGDITAQLGPAFTLLSSTAI